MEKAACPDVNTIKVSSPFWMVVGWVPLNGANLIPKLKWLIMMMNAQKVIRLTLIKIGNIIIIQFNYIGWECSCDPWGYLRDFPATLHSMWA